MVKNVYLVSALVDDNKIYKIGYTRRDVNVRINEFKTGNPYEFEILKVYTTDKYGSSIEKKLHSTFNSKKINGEWFQLDQEDIDNFLNLCDVYHDMFNTLCDNTYLNDIGASFK